MDYLTYNTKAVTFVRGEWTGSPFHAILLSIYPIWFKKVQANGSKPIIYIVFGVPIFGTRINQGFPSLGTWLALLTRPLQSQALLDGGDVGSKWRRWWGAKKNGPLEGKGRGATGGAGAAIGALEVLLSFSLSLSLSLYFLPLKTFGFTWVWSYNLFWCQFVSLWC